ncbi:hypothetical protein P171DRAFT_480549 [Karstenula rhodostoma CBS 690.94]|uniref:Uncharacterized protein n=1 Tax=Karstenula rhodostoma CBS 690.94 TaxID=1392251 RepID=A0A9P4UHD6_9PLEO|nr:hypothetical protein P171DRAFT_480549 [Karstenula rhodostoma CBS 690.94]
MYLINIILNLCFLASSTAAILSLPDPDGDFCATAYGYLIPNGVNLYKNTCGSVSSNKAATATNAQNLNCVTCWFFSGDNCGSDIVWYGLIAPKQKIYFNPARSYICRK